MYAFAGGAHLLIVIVLQYQPLLTMFEMSELETKPKNREITKIWLHNNVSASLIIPIEIARKHNLTKGNHVIVEDTDQGILIRKLYLEAD